MDMTTPMNSLLVLMTSILGAFIVCKHLSISQSLGYLLMGIILGPLGLNFFHGNAMVEGLSHVGLLLFLFAVGLEIPFHRILALGRWIVALGLVQTSLTSAVLFGILIFFLPWGCAAIVAVSLSFSSTAVVIQLLSERHELTTQLGRKTLSILLFQDIAAIFLFMVLGFINSINSAAGGGVNIAATSIRSMILVGMGGVAASLLIGKIITVVTEKWLAMYRSGEFVTGFVLLTVLLFSSFTEMVHLSCELGAFIAGVAMAGTYWRHDISAEIHPLRSLFLAVFFIALALEIQHWPQAMDWVYIMGTLLVVTAVKLGVIFLMLWRSARPMATSLGILVSGSSEFLFILLPSLEGSLGDALKTGPLSSNNLLIMAFLSMTITPLIFQWYRRWSRQSAQDQELSHCPSAIIAGFGPVGQTIAQAFENNLIPFTVVDYQDDAITAALSKSYVAHNGDLRDVDFLKQIKLHEARLLLITFGHLDFAPELVRTLRRKFPDLIICAQVHDYQEANALAGLGIHVVVPEMVESGISMASVALRHLGFASDYANKMTHISQHPLFFGLGKN